MQNILCFYRDSNDDLNFNILHQCFKEYNLDLSKDFDKAKNLYNSKEYYIVVVDFTTTVGKDFLDYVVKTNPEQKIITMSGNFECSVIQGCDYCQKNYKRRRIFKPIKLKELIDTIQNYDDISCPYKNKFDDIFNILDKIVMKYNCFEYKIESFSIVPIEDVSTNNMLQELIEITELLKENNIEYSVDNNYKIVVKNRAIV